MVIYAVVLLIAIGRKNITANCLTSFDLRNFRNVITTNIIEILEKWRKLRKNNVRNRENYDIQIYYRN